MIEAQVVLFAIQATLKIYAGARQAYVDATLDRELVLPLPRAPDLSKDINNIVEYFNTDEGNAVRLKNELVQTLLQNPAQNEAELKALYLYYFAEINDFDEEQMTGVEISAADLTNLLTIRQWGRNENPGHPGAFQRIAGTIVEIAVDYFATMPGAVSEARPEGRALLAFLKGMSDVEFATKNPDDLAKGVMIGVLDAVAATPTLLVTGEKEQLLIAGMTTALAKAIDRPDDVNTEKKKRDAADWAQVVSAALARGATDTVLANPSLFLGKTDAGKIVLQDVIAQVADLAFGADKVELQKVLSTEGLTTIAQAALGAISRNPEILGSNNTGLKKLVSEVTATLAISKIKAGQDLAPHLISLVLERSAANLDLLWEGDRDDPGRNLLVVAARQTLTVLSTVTTGPAKTPTFAQDQLLSILDAVFAQVQENPAWVVDQVTGHHSETVSAALAAALAALKGRKHSQFGAEAVRDALRASLLAVGARLEFLDHLPADDAAAGKAFLTAILDAVLSAALETPMPASRRWQIARASVIQPLVETSFSLLAKKGVTRANLVILRVVLDDLVSGKIRPDDFATALDSKLPG